jgi:hypothetical protein
MLELEREGGILDRLLDRLSQRRTFFLEEPVVKSLRGRRGYQVVEFQVELPEDISGEEAAAFVRMWARRLAEGWVDAFGPPGMDKEEREKWIKSVASRMVKSAASKGAAALPPSPPPPPPRPRRRVTARAVEETSQ